MGLLDYVLGKAIVDTSRDLKKIKNEEQQHQSSEQHRLTANLSDQAKIKQYLSLINTDIEPYIFHYDFSYETDFISDSLLEDPNVSEIMLERKTCISILQNDPQAQQTRCHLVEILLESINSYKYTNTDITQYLIDECRYHLQTLLSQFSSTIKTEPVKYLVMAADAELYIIQGQYSNALKRYFQILNWDLMITNVYKTNNWEYNGTESMYAAIISNIINTFALLSLPEKAEEIRHLFSQIIDVDSHNLLFSYNLPNSDEQLKIYTQDCLHAYKASHKALGFYSMSPISSNTSPNGLWGCYVTDDIGKPIYVTGYFIFNSSKYTIDGLSYNSWNEPINNEAILEQRKVVVSMFDSCESVYEKQS